MELDHVLIAVEDLEATGRELEERHGLSSIVGGRHPGWGTGNRIVPLGDTYIELVAVVDSAEAAQAAFGRLVGSSTGSTPTPFAWCVRTDDLDGVAARLGLEPEAGSRERPGGSIVRWRIAGLEQAADVPCLPFFIEWAEGTPFPGSAEVDHPVGAAELTRLELSGDPRRVDDWLGGAALPVSVAPGEPAITGVIVSVGEKEVAVA
jgi:glyoxalase-like protein